jgi:acyl-homoserine-lactone acylase
MRRPKRSLLALLLLVACGSPAPPPQQPEPELVPLPPPADPRVEIIWDSWGVPHIFARDAESLFFAFGWAQTKAHANLLLRLYGQARARGAEYWGEEFLENDRWLRLNGVPARATEWLAAQSPEMRTQLDAFVRGINAYARDNAESIDESARRVLPVVPADIFAHLQRVIHYTFLASPEGMRATIRAFQAGAPVPRPDPPAQSNAWAIGQSRSASGRTLLLANPHLPWSDRFTFFEAQLVAPGIDASGAALVGLPLPSIAFNEQLGWTHTVNTMDGVDLYELTLAGDGYRWDGAVRAFETAAEVIRVRRADGSMGEERLTVRRSLHGPVIAERNGRALALRVTGLDAPHLAQQTWEMLRARNMAEFETALARLQLPLFTVIYADAQGHILHVFNGRVPVRARGGWREWSGIMRGDSSRTLWTRAHAYAELPRVLDPPGGWLQNANDPPWTTTLPPPLDPARFPAYMAPRLPLSFRPQRSARMLVEDDRIGFDELIAYKHSTRMESADHLVDDVVIAARASGNETARRAANILAAWDRRADADSKGAVLFQALYRELQQRTNGNIFDLAWSERAPFTTPDGLADPAVAVTALIAAAAQVQTRFGALDVTWGATHRLQRDSVNLPANGASDPLGAFRVTDYQDTGEGPLRATGGDSWTAVVEFGSPVRAMALLSYGNESQPGSPHRTDQLRLYSEQRLRPVWRTRTDIEANSRMRKAFSDGEVERQR